jgi:hypothetical protein
VSHINQYVHHAIMHSHPNGANDHNLTWVVVSHTYNISILHELIRINITILCYNKYETHLQNQAPIHQYHKHNQRKQLGNHHQNYHWNNKNLTMTIMFVFLSVSIGSSLLVSYNFHQSSRT